MSRSMESMSTTSSLNGIWTLVLDKEQLGKHPLADQLLFNLLS